MIEMAQASGFGLATGDPTRTTTYGTGELIAAAVGLGCQTLIVCVGGSATVDGGAGLIQALGGRFIDHAGRLIAKPLTGATLGEVAACERPVNLPRIRVACDVTNPLFGPRGAARTYGPQKGATPRQVEQLDAALRHLASVCGDPEQRGAGAAGGAGFGLAALCDATLEPGIELVLDVVEFRRRCRDADLVVTGEGRLDAQTLHGKACAGVAKAAAEFEVPTIAIAGQVDRETDFGILFRSVSSLADRYGLDRARAEPQTLLTAATVEALQAISR